MSYHGLGFSIGPSLPGGMTAAQIASTPPPQTANPDTGSFMSFSSPTPPPTPTKTPGLITRLVDMASLHPGSLLAPKTTPAPAPTPDQTTPAPTPGQTAPDFTQQLTPPPSGFPWQAATAIGAGVLVLGVGGWFLLRKKKDVTPNRRRRRR